jgi:hypothetical protein
MCSSARSPSKDSEPVKSSASPGAANVSSGSSSPAPDSGSPPRVPVVTLTPSGCASSRTHGSAASRTSPPRDAFTRPHAEQRIRRILALPGQPGLLHTAREIGIKRATLDSQIRQLEAASGTTLLRTGPDGTITLTLDGEQFARDVAPVLDMLAATGH